MRKWIQPIRFVVQACFMASLFLPLIHPETVANRLFWTVLLVGVFFCGWVCPFGTAQDWLAWVALKCHFPRFKMPWRLQRYLQFSRYIFLGLMVGGITFSFSNARFYFQDNLVHQMLTWTSGLILAIFLLVGLFLDRPFCNYFCMKGAADGLMSLIRLISIRRDKQACVHCKLCDKICPMNVPVEQISFVRHPNCINCMRCINICPKTCISFGLMRVKIKKPSRD